MKTTHAICLGGILTSIAVLFQAAPVFLPTIGLVLSPLSTLPIILAAVFEIPIGIMVLFSSALLLFAISPQEAVIMLLTTGPLGIAIGGLLFRRGFVVTLLFSTVSLFFGILFMTYVVGIPAFGDFTESFSSTITLMIYLLFSFIYVGFWTICVRRFIERLVRAGLFRSFFDCSK